MKYNFAINNAFTTLNGGISSGATSMIATSAALFPTTGWFVILIDTELILVILTSGTTWTIVRGWESTTAAAHSNGATITGVMTAAGVDSLRPLFRRKTADESVLNSTTLQNDNDLILPVNINEIWVVTYVLFYTASTTGDLQVNWTMPSGSRRHSVLGLGGGTTGEEGVLRGSASVSNNMQTGGAGSGTVINAQYNVLFKVGGTAGNINLQWAQTNLDGAVPTVVLTDSYMLADLVG